MKLAASLCVALLLTTACSARKQHDVEAEALEGVTNDPRYGVMAGSQWASYEQATYSGRRAALTRAAEAAMTASFDDLNEVEAVRAEVVVFNYGGAGRNSFEISVGKVTKRITFGGAGSPAGLLRIGDLYFVKPESGKLTIRSVSVAQPYLVIDKVRLVEHEGKVPEAVTAWEKVEPEIQGRPCRNCVQAESLQPVNGDADYGTNSAAGWASYSEPNYSNGRAAITRLPGAVMRGRIPKFTPGSYVVTIAATVLTGAPNELDLQLGDVTRRIRFGGPGFTPGVTLIENVPFDGVASDHLAIRAGAVGQAYLIVDALSLVPGRADAGTHAWTVSETEPIDALCIACVEAEAMKAVSSAADYGTAAGAGWASYGQPLYSGERAALTRLAGAAMQAAAPDFRPGSYDVVLTVLDQGGAVNSLDVTMGGVTRTVSFGGGPAGGLKRLPPVRFDDVKDGSVTVRAKSVGQAYVIVDNISFRRAS